MVCSIGKERKIATVPDPAEVLISRDITSLPPELDGILLRIYWSNALEEVAFMGIL
jgi:hypothetical protein